MERRRFLARVVAAAPPLVLGRSLPASARQKTKKDQAKGEGDFVEARTGVVPEGTLEMMTPNTDRAIERGLAWLAKQQNNDGSFGNSGYHVAVSSLAGLAFMASGSSPGRGLYGPQIDKAVLYVLDNTAPSGFICEGGAGANSPMYGHGFGTLFLAEAYGMTRRAEIREKLEKAVRLIVDTQNREGGWRYQPVRADADLSVTICQINALRAARNAGLYVPKETVENCIKYVKQSQNADGGFRYMLMHGTSAFARSAAGVVALFSAGEYDTKEVQSGIRYLKAHLPGGRGGGMNQNHDPHYFYAHYYAAQAMWIHGGKEWNDWFPAIRDELIRTQNAAGFWNDNFGNEYGSAMALIVLQMPNNCLPIFQR